MRQIKKSLYILIIILAFNSCHSYYPKPGYYKLDISPESVIAGTNGAYTIDDIIDEEGFWRIDLDVPFIRAINIGYGTVQLYHKDGTISEIYKISSCKKKKGDVQIQFSSEDGIEKKYGLQFFGSDSLRFGIMENKKKLNGFIYKIATKSEQLFIIKYEDIVSYLQNDEIIGKCKSVRDTIFSVKKEFGKNVYYLSSCGISTFNEYGSLINKKTIDSSGNIVYDEENTYTNSHKEKTEIYWTDSYLDTPEKLILHFDSLGRMTYYDNSKYSKTIEYKYYIKNDKKVSDIIDSKTNKLLEKIITEPEEETFLEEAHYESDGDLYYKNYYLMDYLSDGGYSFSMGYPNGFFITLLGELRSPTFYLGSEVPYTKVDNYSYGYNSIELEKNNDYLNYSNKLGYDSYGNIQLSICTFKEKRNNRTYYESFIYTYKYVFDSNCNWIKRRIYKDGELYSLETRTIEY